MTETNPKEPKPYSTPRFLPAGDGAVTIEVANIIDPAVNDMVVTIDRHIHEAAIKGIVETVPTYRSIQVIYDPVVVRFADLVPRLRALIPDQFETPADRTRWHVPVNYGGENGMDLEYVAGVHDLTTQDVIDLHSAAEYRVYMIGFMPGFTYLGGLPESLHTSRRENPRTLTPASSVSIGGIQGAISSMPCPSGWHMLGRAPIRTFDARRENPFLLATGDLVSFRPIDKAEFDRLDALADKGEIIAEPETVSG
ncbi:MAG: 5-oxoprolinase subunit PxpB [Rhodospirillales bacterium]|nr:5-oxoprolinase subunit PxpB [Rhodospirillales bacterium]